MPTTRRRRPRRQRDEYRELMLRYFRGEALSHSEKLRVLTSTAQPGGKSLDEWRHELSDEI